jgi:hypothetical protein
MPAVARQQHVFVLVLSEPGRGSVVHRKRQLPRLLRRTRTDPVVLLRDEAASRHRRFRTPPPPRSRNAGAADLQRSPPTASLGVKKELHGVRAFFFVRKRSSDPNDHASRPCAHVPTYRGALSHRVWARAHMPWCTVTPHVRTCAATVAHRHTSCVHVRRYRGALSHLVCARAPLPWRTVTPHVRTCAHAVLAATPTYCMTPLLMGKAGGSRAKAHMDK